MLKQVHVAPLLLDRKRDRHRVLPAIRTKKRLPLENLLRDQGKLGFSAVPERCQLKGGGQEGFVWGGHRDSGTVKHVMNLQKSTELHYAYPLKTAERRLVNDKLTSLPEMRTFIGKLD